MASTAPFTVLCTVQPTAKKTDAYCRVDVRLGDITDAAKKALASAPLHVEVMCNNHTVLESVELVEPHDACNNFCKLALHQAGTYTISVRVQMLSAVSSSFTLLPPPSS